MCKISTDYSTKQNTKYKLTLRQSKTNTRSIFAEYPCQHILVQSYQQKQQNNV